MMDFAEFIQTKGFGFLCCLIAFIASLKIVYDSGYSRGYKKGLKDNPKRIESSHYVFSDGRILRFMEGERPVVIDVIKNTVTTVFPAEEPKEEK